MTITVHLFAHLREIAGRDRIAIELPEGSTIVELRSRLVIEAPALFPLLERSAIAVNHDFAEYSQILNASDEVAVIPPVSGG
jgi:molybdopterin converting factor subunit 1